jgi:hypothetical protein
VAENRRLDQAEKLLRQVLTTKRPLDQRLLVAAALSTVMTSPPIVVGGTAEEYWTGDEYHPTDLDLIPGPSSADLDAFRKLGFKKEGRHWVREDFPIATEFPHDESFEVRRTFDEKVSDVIVKVIGVDDLYLDRLGQSTMTENVRDQHFASLLAVAVANWDKLDWSYIDKRIAEIAEGRPALGKSMRIMHRRCRRASRNALARRSAELL